MPIYEYVCPECNNRFEQMRPLSHSDKAVECPKCHKPARRKMSTFACFSNTEGGISQTIAGTGSSCSSCTSGDCSTCAS
jgi:putative FmdB family regulatory protein